MIHTFAIIAGFLTAVGLASVLPQVVAGLEMHLVAVALGGLVAGLIGRSGGWIDGGLVGLSMMFAIQVFLHNMLRASSEGQVGLTLDEQLARALGATILAGVVGGILGQMLSSLRKKGVKAHAKQ